MKKRALVANITPEQRRFSHQNDCLRELKKKKFLFIIAIFSLFPVCLSLYGSLTLAQTSPEFPYPDTRYNENYRPQFHFSPQGGWMNDVNGLWYDNGVYHITFQHYPHGLNWGAMHWGHATSPDMLRWTQQPIALEPRLDEKGNLLSGSGINTQGMAFSGSVVVDLNNSSGLKTGANAVVVAIYTDTAEGTSLAYSNDRGATWQRYAGNPVIPSSTATSPAGPRDPHVFWHEPTQKWVLALYKDHGTAFYTSSDLKTWQYTSWLAFGFECPDMFELPVDGNQSNKKWVVADADGKYVIGQFDGEKFVSDPGMNLNEPFRMDEGPDFYAAQTFFRPTFPDNRVVQFAWHSRWDRPATQTTPWSREATFPAELQLKTFPDGIRLTRYPISEISTLHTALITVSNQTVTAGSNLLDRISSETCDIQAEFDLIGTTATQFGFTLAGRTLTYDIPARTLEGKPLAPSNDRIKLRILRDWGLLEVFGNDGRLSYSDQVAFPPKDGSLAVWANGSVKLVSLTANEVERTWPALPANVTTNLAVP